MRFLFTRRWVLFALVVAALAYLAVILGQWQFHRLEDRKGANALVAKNLDSAPVPVESVLRVGAPADEQDEWRRVVVHGTWDDSNTIVLKYQTRDGGPGVDVVTPLVTEDGTAVLVDRGWMATANDGATRPSTPPAPDGPVTVTGWVRVDASGRAAKVSDHGTRAISSVEAAKVLPYPLYGGFLDLDTQTPEPAVALARVELPDDTSNGPHFFYGLQWWFFGALAVFGFGYLAYDEARRTRTERNAAATADASAED